jgi:hypothetical protein
VQRAGGKIHGHNDRFDREHSTSFQCGSFLPDDKNGAGRVLHDSLGGTTEENMF